MNKDFSSLTYKNGLKDGLPIGLGYLSVSFAFGVQASLCGVPVFIALLISMTNLTSAGQLAGLEIIARCGSILEIIVTQLVINSRYFLMSFSLSQKLDNSFGIKSRFLSSFAITDEIFAVSSLKGQNISNKYFFGLMILPYFGWATGTLLGATLGNVMPLFISSALGIALYAMFIAIFVPPAVKNKSVLLVVSLSALFSCLLYYLPIFSAITSGFKVVISALIASVITAFIFPIKENEDANT